MLPTKLLALSAVLLAVPALAVPLAFGSIPIASNIPGTNHTDSTVSVGSGQGIIVLHAHRIQSPNWAPCFALVCDNGTGPGVAMYFVVYNSSKVLIGHGYADENGTQITGLNIGQNYSIYPADCDNCHNSTHSVKFVNWGGADNRTDRPRTFLVNDSSSAVPLDVYYRIVELGANSTVTSSDTSSTAAASFTVTAGNSIANKSPVP